MPLSRARLLPGAVMALHRQWPDATIEIVEGSHAELLEPLRDGALDLMIGALREVAPADLVQAPLLKDRPVVVASAGHPLAGREPTTADLTPCPWANAPRGTPLRLL